MTELELKVDPQFVQKFRDLGGSLVKLGELVDRLDSLLMEITPLTDSLQALMSDISADLNIAQTPGAASRATRRDAGGRAALAAASIFYVISQVPGIMSLMSEMSSLADLNSLTSKERKELALRLREEGRKLEALARPDSVRPVASSKQSKIPIPRKSRS